MVPNLGMFCLLGGGGEEESLNEKAPKLGMFCFQVFECQGAILNGTFPDLNRER